MVGHACLCVSIYTYTNSCVHKDVPDNATVFLPIFASANIFVHHFPVVKSPVVLLRYCETDKEIKECMCVRVTVTNRNCRGIPDS